MAIIIKPKRSETADSAPGTSDIVDGEIAINIADKKIYIRHSDDTIVTLSDAANLTSASTSTIDAVTDIILDADGGDIFFKDGGTTFGSATNTSGNLIIKSGTTTAATFSGANVTLAGTVGSGAITSTGVVTGTGFTIGSAAILEAELEILDGANVTTTELNLLDGSAKSTSSITIADTDAFIVIDGTTTKQIPASDISTYAGGGGGGATYNGLINGDFTVWQRATSFTSTNSYNNDNSYTADRWLLVSAGSDIVDVTRQAGDTDTSLYSIALDVETIDLKFGIVQIIEQKNCGALGEIPTSTVSLSFKAKVSGSGKLDNIKAAVISWDGSADSVTSDIVSAWDSEGTNPVLKTNLTYENTPANLNVTTSWVRYKIENISVDTAGTNNLIVFIWSDVADTDLGDFLYVTDVQLEPGDTANDYRREHIGTTMANCQRYFQPALLVAMHAYFAAGVIFGHYWTCEMRATPTVTLEYASTSNRMYRIDNAATADVTWAGITTTSRGMSAGYGWSPSSWASAAGVGFQTTIKAEAEL
ncbi:MAG: hypothetical protein COC11_00975 [Candidatus Neomarinimicrobiota bacterium]|nr:MAG: hypothetical protein COC11_00975 [Candidatus Neomarinimicrobiota bacterium]